MYQINIMRFAYKKVNNINSEKNYRKVLVDLNKRLKLRYKIKLNIKKICSYIKTLNTKITYGKLYDIVMSDLYTKVRFLYLSKKIFFLNLFFFKIKKS